MPNIYDDFGIPAELAAFVDDGFLEILSSEPDEKTITFHIPALRYEDENRKITAFDLTWIHPEFNAQFCHYYVDTPGDLANFYLSKQSTDSAEEPIEAETLDDLIDWLQEKSAQVKDR